MAERYNALTLVTSPFVRKRSNPIFDKSFFIFIFYFLVYFFSAYKSINDCFNIREIVILYALGKVTIGLLPSARLGAIAQF